MTMRNLKFRFWDRFNEEFTYSEGMALSRFFTLFEACTDGENDPILEHFTGLHDMDGNEIYEGDRLTSQIAVVLGLDGDIVDPGQQVYFCDTNDFWMMDTSLNQNKEEGDPLDDELRLFKYKLVGNIHEKEQNQ